MHYSSSLAMEKMFRQPTRPRKITSTDTTSRPRSEDVRVIVQPKPPPSRASVIKSATARGASILRNALTKPRAEEISTHSQPTMPKASVFASTAARRPCQISGLRSILRKDSSTPRPKKSVRWDLPKPAACPFPQFARSKLHRLDPGIYQLMDYKDRRALIYIQCKGIKKVCVPTPPPSEPFTKVWLQISAPEAGQNHRFSASWLVIPG